MQQYGISENILHMLLVGAIAIAFVLNFNYCAYAQVTTPNYGNSAPHKMVPKLANKKILAKPESRTERWKVKTINNQTTHVGCEATSQPDEHGAVISVLMKADNKVTGITVSNVDFGFGNTDSHDYGLWQVDGADPIAVFARSVDQWTTSLEIHKPTDGKPSRELSEFSTGDKLTLLFGTRKYVLDLAQTGPMIRALKVCNEKGQVQLDRERIKLATIAPTRNEKA